MAKNKESKEDSDDTKKQTHTFRLSSETARRLASAALATERSKTAYVEFALKNQFKKDGIQ
jgi:predicted transcriptional regulator